MAIGGNTVLPVMTSLLGQLLDHTDWRGRHAALLAVCQVTEGCAKQMAQEAQGLVDMVLSKCADPHPRVRYAAVHTIGYMCSDFDSVIQQQFHEPVCEDEGLLSLFLPHACLYVE